MTEGRHLRVAITGASGLIGTALRRFLRTGGHEIFTLVRDQQRTNEHAIYWQPEAGEIDRARLEGLDAIVNLAGENVGEGRWTAERKTRIRESRVQGTTLLAKTLASLEQKPRVLVSSSGVSYYGDRGDEVVDEDSTPGEGFLAEVSRAWEEACAPASEAGIRVVNMRTGLVLSAEGGALPKMLTPFRFGVGGRIAGGNQYMSWIAIDDFVRAILFVIERDALVGAVNAVAPEPVTNAELTSALGEVLARPAVFAVPSFALKLAFGEMAEETVLSGQRVVPRRLQQAGFTWRHRDIRSALKHVLGK